MNNPHKTQ